MNYLLKEKILLAYPGKGNFTSSSQVVNLEVLEVSTKPILDNDITVSEEKELLDLLKYLYNCNIQLYHYMFNKVEIIQFKEYELKFHCKEFNNSLKEKLEKCLRTNDSYKGFKVIAIIKEDFHSLKEKYIKNLENSDEWLNLKTLFHEATISDILMN